MQPTVFQPSHSVAGTGLASEPASRAAAPQDSADNAVVDQPIPAGCPFAAGQSLAESKPSLRPEWIAASAVLIAFAAMSLIKVPCNDIGWHLATARVADQTGHWPTVNTFSHTHSSYPLFQQYPLFQAVLYRTFQIGGWAGLSVLNCVGWLVALLWFVRWGGPWRRAIMLHLPWMVAVMALQRRMILRPDMVSVILLGVLLVTLDRYRRTGRWWWLAPTPVLHWIWANSHQLFPLCVAVQGLFLVHILVSRRGWPWIDQRDARLPIRPVAVSITLSAIASFGTPLGTRIVEVVIHAGGSLTHHRNDVEEFARIWTQPIDLQLMVLCAYAGLWGIWRMRRQIPFFEIGLWLATLAMTLAAVRGLVFFGLVSVAILSRSFRRNGGPWTQQANAEPQNTAGSRSVPDIARWAMMSLTLIFATKAVFYRWVDPPLALGGTQPGWGQSAGDWPHGAVTFLRKSPPPGKMMNMPWSLADGLIWDAPEHPVFVDPRLETYPRDFLVDCMASYKDDAVLDRLILEHQIHWIIANHRKPDVRERIARLHESGNWPLVYADTGWAILVQKSPDHQTYINANRIAPEDMRPNDLLDSPPQLVARQRIHYAEFLARFGQVNQATEQLRLAERTCLDSEIKHLIQTARAGIDNQQPPNDP